MLLGYDKKGEIKFYFTDDDYLKTYFPNNSAKISNFWKKTKHGLKELFVDKLDANVKLYKVINNKVVKKSKDEIRVAEKSCSVETRKIKVKKKKHKVEEVKLSKPKEIKNTAQETGEFSDSDKTNN